MIKDCDLMDPTDDYILKWLVGKNTKKFLQLIFKTNKICYLLIFFSKKFQFGPSRENATSRKLNNLHNN